MDPLSGLGSPPRALRPSLFPAHAVKKRVAVRKVRSHPPAPALTSLCGPLPPLLLSRSLSLSRRRCLPNPFRVHTFFLSRFFYGPERRALVDRAPGREPSPHARGTRSRCSNRLEQGVWCELEPNGVARSLAPARMQTMAPPSATVSAMKVGGLILAVLAAITAIVLVPQTVVRHRHMFRRCELSRAGLTWPVRASSCAFLIRTRLCRA